MSRRVLSLTLFAFAILLCGLSNRGLAQLSGNVSGVVSDPTGAVVPGVALTLTNKALERRGAARRPTVACTSL